MVEPEYTLRAIARFMKKAGVRGLEWCWLWRGKTSRGYGTFHYRSEVSAHRASWVLHFGPIPPGRWVLHSCDNKRCVNPKHLHLGTHADNHREFMERGDFKAKNRGMMPGAEHRRRWPHLYDATGRRLASPRRTVQSRP